MGIWTFVLHTRAVSTPGEWTNFQPSDIPGHDYDTIHSIGYAHISKRCSQPWPILHSKYGPGSISSIRCGKHSVVGLLHLES